MKNEELYVNIHEMASTLVVPRQCVNSFRKILPVCVALLGILGSGMYCKICLLISLFQVVIINFLLKCISVK
jgi:hypothetical protein